MRLSYSLEKAICAHPMVIVVFCIRCIAFIALTIVMLCLIQTSQAKTFTQWYCYHCHNMCVCPCKWEYENIKHFRNGRVYASNGHCSVLYQMYCFYCFNGCNAFYINVTGENIYPMILLSLPQYVCVSVQMRIWEYKAFRNGRVYASNGHCSVLYQMYCFYCFNGCNAFYINVTGENIYPMILLSLPQYMCMYVHAYV